jgi:hypothetical protein
VHCEGRDVSIRTYKLKHKDENHRKLNIRRYFWKYRKRVVRAMGGEKPHASFANYTVVACMFRV